MLVVSNLSMTYFWQSRYFCFGLPRAQGRNLTLLAMDDDYEPALALVNFYNLSNKALLLVGVYGSAIVTALLNPAVSTTHVFFALFHSPRIIY